LCRLTNRTQHTYTVLQCALDVVFRYVAEYICYEGFKQGELLTRCRHVV